MNGKLAIGSAAVASILLAACGGGGGGAAVQSSSSSVSVSVIDGPIQNATVCLDKNANGACDAGEPAGTTNAAGAVTLTVDAADVGKYSVIAVVGTNAVDADTGAVPVAYVMKAPPDQSAVVSPLTTLVHAQMENTGSDTATAAAFIKEQTGLNISVFADYTKTSGTDPNAALAAKVAQVMVATTQQQSTALASELGKPDITGATITQAAVNKVINQALLGLLPNLTAAANESSSAAAIQSAAAALVTQTGLTPATVAAVVGVSNLPKDTEVAAVAPAPSAAMTTMRFVDANNWYYRALLASAADNTLDAKGLRHFYDEHKQNDAGVPATWSWGANVANKDDLHWNGSAWVACAIGQRSSATPYDAKGNSTFDYCDGRLKGTSQRNVVDVSGKTLAEVTTTIRSFPGADNGIAYANWGPANTAMLGTAAFPADSKILYNTNFYTSAANTYIPAAQIGIFSAAVAAGGPSASSACGTPGAAVAATTLEELIGRNTGTPCVFPQETNADGTSLASNEVTGFSTVGAGPFGTITPPSPYYTSNALLRVSFATSGNGVNFYSCLQRKVGLSPRNCTLKGTGSYTIATQGDARVLTLNYPSAVLQSNGAFTVYVERGGKVYSGYRLSTAPALSARLNLAAANAMLGQLGMPVLVPN